jgi:1-acyl-sn-glycerol-3-phosphate acyltransferase
MPGEDPLKIDVAQILRDKSPGISKLMPRFLINYLRKIIHEEDLNNFFRDFGNLHNVDLVRAGLTYMGIEYSVHNKEAIPTSGRNIFVSNHPLGGLDGLVFMTELSKYFDNIKFPVNDILMNVTNMEEVFLPINKHGAQGRDAAKAIDEAYASDSQILYFPAGLCSRKIKGEIKDLVWHKSFISKAIKHKRTIVPVYFSGRNSDFFYKLSNIRVGLGIKWNLEMLYLVDEMFRQTGKDLHIVFGKGYDWDMFDKSKTPIEWANWLKSKSYELAKYLPDQNKKINFD